MNNEIIQRINRIYKAFDKVNSSDISVIRPKFANDSYSSAYRVDFGIDALDAINYAQSLVSNIASIKDHLKEWCKENNSVFNGDKLINSNRDVAIIHDLWNLEKHKKLNTKPRSGYLPQIIDLRRTLRLTSQMNSGIQVYVDSRDGNLKTYTEELENANSALVIDGKIVSEKGMFLGNFLSVCQNATEAWENLLAQSGVNLNP